MKIIKLLIFALLIVAAAARFAHGKPRQEKVSTSYTDPKIHTVLFHTEGWEFSLPVLELGSSQRVVLKYDELSRNPKSYHYALVHCDADWNPSRVTPSEYMEGFPENPVNDYAYSINTTIPFVNYRLVLPNEDVKICISGNYLLKIWENSERDKPILVRPFYVTEKQVEISGEVRKSAMEGYKGTSQQVAFAVNYPGFTITDPLNEIKTVVMQNSRTDNRRTNLKPTYIRQNQLYYDDGTNPFKGGNEFRNFNAKNLQTNGMGIKAIEYRDPLYHIFLETDQSFGSQMYRAWDDLNGSFLVKNDRAADSDLEADYINVHFSLIPPDQMTNPEIYVFGALSGWQCLPANQMKYNSETKLYEATILLKQGFYDYQYVIFNKETQEADFSSLEGSHVETENDYHLFVYYRGFSSRYDRLVGYRMINSVKR